MAEEPHTADASTQPPEKGGLRNWLYRNLIDSGPATISVVERIDQPMTFWESTRNTVISAAKGSAISALLGALAGGLIGAVGGTNDNSNPVEKLTHDGSVTLGGGNVPGIGSGPSVTVHDSAMHDFAASHPSTANAMLSAADQGITMAARGAVVGGVIGAIKGGWVDRITKEREIVPAQPLERT